MIKRLCYFFFVIILFTLSSCKMNKPPTIESVSNNSNESKPKITLTPATYPTIVVTDEPVDNLGFAGRILIATHDSEGYAIYTLQEGFTYPVPLWIKLKGDLPESYKNQPSKDYPVAVSSPDGYWVVLNNTLVNLKTGESRNIIDENQFRIYPSFSPDNRYLVVGVGGFDTPARLLILNLAEGTEKEIYTGDCQEYAYGGIDLGGNATTYCGEIDQPTWLDENTIIFSIHRGKMPSCVYCGQSDTLDPIAFLVMTPDGEILHEVSQKGIVFKTLFRNEDYLQKEWLINKSDLIQAIQYSDEHSPEFIFLSVAELKEGVVITENTSNDMSQGWNEIIPSPDGVYLFDPSGKLINANTKVESKLPLFNNCHTGMLWSPDSSNLVCISKTNSSSFPLTIYSIDQESPVFSFDLGILAREWWNLIAWQP